MRELIIILVFVNVCNPWNYVVAQNSLGIGLRLGDPSGITVKKYFSDNAFEISVGRTYRWSGDRWYDKRFYKWYDHKKFGYKDFQYLGYAASAPIGIQAHYLFINDFSKSGIVGMQWYYGVGLQLRYQRFSFDYRYKLEGNPDWIYSYEERVTDLDIGVDGVIGLEYKIKSAPVSIFADITLFMEVADNPFYFWFQGGIGGRYNF